MRSPAFALALSCALLGAAAGPAVPEAPESAAALVKRAAAELEAARPKSEIVDATIASAGLTGMRHEERRGNDFVETTVLGPFTTLRGSVGGKAWHQDENGTTVLDEPEPSQTVPPELSSTLAHVAQPRDLYVVTTTLASGATRATSYDARDLAIVREKTTRGKHFSTIDYDDFRPWSGGKRRAWHARGADDRGNTYSEKITSDRIGASIADADFTIPPSRRTLVEFPQGVNQVALPAKVEGGRIHVTVEVNGNPLTFVLDSGASGIVIDAQAARDLKLPSYGASAYTVAGTFTSSRVVAPVVRVGPLVMRDVAMLTAPLDEREGNDRVVGLLGFDFIAGAVLRIDYIDPGGVQAIRPGVFTPPLLATSAMRVRLNRQVPVVHVGVGDAASDDMIVDTGAEAPVLFFDRFIKTHPGAVVDRGFDAPFDPAQNVVFGVGGAVPIVPLRIASFRFADLDFRNYLVLRAADAGAFNDTSDDGLLGALFLRFYTLYIDYPDRKLYFEPNENYRRAIAKPLEP